MFGLFCEINKIYYGYEMCLGRQLCKILSYLHIRLLIPRRMPKAYAWLMVSIPIVVFLVMADQNHIEGFHKKVFSKYYQLQTTWCGFHCLLEIKSQQDLSYYKSADKKFVYRFITFLLWVSTFLLTTACGCRVLLNTEILFWNSRVTFFKEQSAVQERYEKVWRFLRSYLIYNNL